MEDNCPYCEQTDGVDPDHCTWCHDAPPAQDEDSCPYCKTDDVGNPDNGDGCPYCVEATDDADDCPYCTDDAASGQKMPELGAEDNHAAQQDPKIQSPDSNNEEQPSGSAAEAAEYDQMGMNPPQIAKPQVGDGGTPAGIGQANPGDATGAPVQPANADPAEEQANDGIPPENAHSKEAMQSIATQIQNETVDGKPMDRQQASQIDDTDIIGNEMEGNVSRPGGYNENTPGDMGLDEDNAVEGDQQSAAPDLSAVLREGLDDQASDIEKDKVRNQVGQALMGFKASKQILENAKVQAPQFYQASIAMLASMIRMAEMLGLSGNVAQGGAMVSDPNSAMPGEEQVMGDSQQQDEWKEPFAKHPDHGGERKPGHSGGAAPAPKDKGAIGQPIGKLPQKATTHVARTPLPPGAINAKGQQKVIDPKTGKVRFIDRKQGMVQSPTGVPVKPPGRGNDGSQN